MVRLFLSEHEASSVVLDTLESADSGVGVAGEERVAVVNAKQSDRDDKFGDRFRG